MYILQFQLFLVPIVESAELSQEIFSSKIEDLVEFSPNVERVQQISYLSQGQGIMDEIDHFDSYFDLAKVVFVMPEPVGSEALFVDKQVRLSQMGYFCHPLDRNPEKRSDPVSND
jgi:hypothetical protein